MKRWDCVAKRMPAGKRIVGAEVGVFKGKMSVELLRLMPKLKLYMVDRWSAYSADEIAGDKSCTMAKHEQEFWNCVYHKVAKKFRHYGDRVEIIKSDSAAAAEKIKNKSLDFVFIDGDHSYEGVKSDIEAWRSKVKKGGYISGHDITREGVRRAVTELLGDCVKDENKTWFVKL